MKLLIKALGGYTHSDLVSRVADAKTKRDKEWMKKSAEAAAKEADNRAMIHEMYCQRFLDAAEDAKRRKHKSSGLRKLANAAKARALDCKGRSNVCDTLKGLSPKLKDYLRA